MFAKMSGAIVTPVKLAKYLHFNLSIVFLLLLPPSQFLFCEIISSLNSIHTFSKNGNYRKNGVNTKIIECIETVKQ